MLTAATFLAEAIRKTRGRKMINSVQSLELKELCTAVVDCPHSTPKWTENGILVLRSRNIRNGRLSLDAQRSYTNEEDYTKRVRRAIPVGGDIVITREAPMGEVCLLPEGLKCCLGQRMVLLRPNPKRVVGRFLCFALQSKVVQHQIGMHEGTGSTVSNLRIPALKELQIPYPPLPEQKRIAAVLGALDDKIENNRKMNETLEAMAQAIFKSWFVDFDPAIDNALRAGNPIPEDLEPKAHRRREAMARDSYKKPPYAHLFPDHFVDSELGSIPEGWSLASLRNLASERKMTVNPENLKPETPYIGLADMPRGSIALSTWDCASSATSNKLSFQSYDILFGKLRPYFKKVGVAPIEGICSSDIIVIQPKSQDSWSYVLCLVSSDPLIDYASAGSTGTRMPRTSWSYLAKFPVLSMPKDLNSAFNSMVREFYEKIKSNIFESRTLTSLRDTLLPKLISGELRVPEIEGLVEEHI